MTLDDIAADITALLGDPTMHFADRAIGIASVTAWVWSHRNAPYGLRLEQVGDRHAVRAWRHTVPDGQRAELIRHGAPTDDEIRVVVVLAGLLPIGATP